MKHFLLKTLNYIRNNFIAEENRYIVLATLLFALGIAFYFALPVEPSPWLSIGLFEIVLLIFYLCRHKSDLHLFFIALLIIFCGFLNIQIRTLYQQKHINLLSQKTTTYISGKVKDLSFNSQGKARLLLQNAADYDQSLKGLYRLTVNSFPADLQTGDCVETVATFFPNRPLPVLNGYQLDRKYFYENISALGFANGEIFKISCSSDNRKQTFLSELNNKRRQIVREINDILPPAQASIASALLVGEKGEISPRLYDNYRNSGLAHILAVSGLHLGAVAGLIFFLIRLLIAFFPFIALRFDGKKIAAVVAIIGSAFYLMISGMAIPAQRAFIMTTVVLIGVLFNRRAISLRMVCFAALIILIISPQALVSISFQMSFAAVFALISFYETYEVKIASFKPQKNWALKIIWYLLGIVICGLVAGLAILPFALYHFHRVALYTSLANLLAGPLIALYIMPVILVCLIAFIFGVYSLPLKLLGFGIELLNRIAGIIADLPHSVWNAQLNFCGFICAVLGLYWLCVWQKPWRKWGFIPLFAGLMFLFYPHPQPDMVFAPNSSQILLKDHSGEMVMLPLKKDLWLQHLWEENFHLKKLSPSEKEKIKNLLSGNDNQENTLSLQCRADECLYKNQVRFNLDGNVFFDDKPVNTENGAYIYLPQKKFKPLWPTDCRPWKNCRPK